MRVVTKAYGPIEADERQKIFFPYGILGFEHLKNYVLLDARRTRIQALDDHAVWQSELWQARTRLARLSGVAPDAAVICSESLGES